MQPAASASARTNAMCAWFKSPAPHRGGVDRNGYPQDLRDPATLNVLQQSEALSAAWAAQASRESRHDRRPTNEVFRFKPTRLQTLALASHALPNSIFWEAPASGTSRSP
jgi:hypothetical protein